MTFKIYKTRTRSLYQLMRILNKCIELQYFEDNKDTYFRTLLNIKKAFCLSELEQLYAHSLSYFKELELKLEECLYDDFALYHNREGCIYILKIVLKRTIEEIKSLEKSIPKFTKGGNGYYNEITAEVEDLQNYNTVTLTSNHGLVLSNDSVIKNMTVREYIDYGISAREAGKLLNKAIKGIKKHKPTLQQRLKDIKEKHNNINKEHEKRISQIKACIDAGQMIAALFGSKTIYDLTGIIRIPKTY
jgi:hypothetical protein